MCYLFFIGSIDLQRTLSTSFIKKTLVGKRSFRLVRDRVRYQVRGVDGELDIHQLRHIRDDAEAKWSERRRRTAFIQKEKENYMSPLIGSVDGVPSPINRVLGNFSEDQQ